MRNKSGYLSSQKRTKLRMNQQKSIKRIIITFGLALVMSLLTIYIQHYSEVKNLEMNYLEANIKPIETPGSIESLH